MACFNGSIRHLQLHQMTRPAALRARASMLTELKYTPWNTWTLHYSKDVVWGNKHRAGLVSPPPIFLYNYTRKKTGAGGNLISDRALTARAIIPGFGHALWCASNKRLLTLHNLYAIWFIDVHHDMYIHKRLLDITILFIFCAFLQKCVTQTSKSAHRCSCARTREGG